MTDKVSRVVSIDLMRGLVMVLMALDHTRDYFSNAMFSPTDLSQTNMTYFMTRWVTHLCAPTFMFLAGVSAYLSARKRHYSLNKLSVYLIQRGAILIAMELTIIRFGWTFNWDMRYGIAQVIWALGWSMIVLAGMIHLPRRTCMTLAIAFIAGHNLFDPVQPDAFGKLAWLWIILHVPGIVDYAPGHSIFIFYPLIPWCAVMALGYCFGSVFLKPQALRQTTYLRLGCWFLLLFLGLRLTNIYGDPNPWMLQKNIPFTVMAILKCEKYPPSLLYLLMTFNMMFVSLACFESPKIQKWFSVLIDFGKVPMFFYLIHIYLIHGLALLVIYYRGLPTNWLISGNIEHAFPEVPTAEFGFSLFTVYLIWLLLLITLYPMCRCYIKLALRYKR
jgi:uncharacterized membrane protein